VSPSWALFSESLLKSNATSSAIHR
jgi:hypothetical protein